jgi:apolipoprotein D and lipocalin family protein
MGEAYSVDTTNTKLKVSFFWPFYGDYWIIKLAEDYRYSIVSEPRKKYLWILSRSKELTSKDRKEILYFLREEGFKTENIFWTKLDKIL